MSQPPDSSALWDNPNTVRSGEELPHGPLSVFISSVLGTSATLDEATASARPMSVEQFRGGHSNLTYLLRFGKDEMVLRRPPFGSNVATAHDMSREFRVLEALGGHYDKVPRVFAYCDDIKVIGAPFYLMERVRGLIIRRDIPSELKIDEVAADMLSRTMIETLAELHQVDYKAAGLDELGRPSGYVGRQVAGWSKRYAKSKTDEIPEAELVATWLAGNQPSSERAALIHNDFKFDNMVLDPSDLSRVRGILDWEMSTIGDPWMDLGTSLCYWVEATDPKELQALAFGPTSSPGMWTRKQLIEHYGTVTGPPVENPTFFYIFGLFKLAVVVQQIYFRFASGHTQDPRFEKLGHAAGVLLRQAAANLP